jgi:carbohydrate-binding DOMON domain-containing protein
MINKITVPLTNLGSSLPYSQTANDSPLSAKLINVYLNRMTGNEKLKITTFMFSTLLFHGIISMQSYMSFTNYWLS